MIWNPFERIGAAVTTALISRVGSASWRDGSLRGADVNDARNDDILNAWFNGGTLTQIAFDYSVTRSTVSGVIKRARKAKDPRATPRRMEYLAAARTKPPKFDPADIDPAWADQSFRPRGGLTIMRLRAFGQCRWPVGDPKTPSFRYCAAVLDQPHDTYCPRHHALSIGPGARFERTAIKDALRAAA